MCISDSAPGSLNDGDMVVDSNAASDICEAQMKATAGAPASFNDGEMGMDNNAASAVCETQMKANISVHASLNDEEMGMNNNAASAVCEAQMKANISVPASLNDEEMGMDNNAASAVCETQMKANVSVPASLNDEEMGMDNNAASAVCETQMKANISVPASLNDEEVGMNNNAASAVCEAQMKASTTAPGNLNDGEMGVDSNAASGVCEAQMKATAGAPASLNDGEMGMDNNASSAVCEAQMKANISVPASLNDGEMGLDNNAASAVCETQMKANISAPGNSNDGEMGVDNNESGDLKDVQLCFDNSAGCGLDNVPSIPNDSLICVIKRTGDTLIVEVSGDGCEEFAADVSSDEYIVIDSLSSPAASSHAGDVDNDFDQCTLSSQPVLNTAANDRVRQDNSLSCSNSLHVLNSDHDLFSDDSSSDSDPDFDLNSLLQICSNSDTECSNDDCEPSHAAASNRKRPTKAGSGEVRDNTEVSERYKKTVKAKFSKSQKRVEVGKSVTEVSVGVNAPCNLNYENTDVDSIAASDLSDGQPPTPSSADCSALRPTKAGSSKVRDNTEVSKSQKRVEVGKSVTEVSVGVNAPCNLNDENTHVDNIAASDLNYGQPPTRSSVQGFTVKPKRSIKQGCKQVYDKTNYCLFCNKAIHSKISRHLLTHKDQKEIADIRLLEPESKPRVAALHQLANDGNFKHNSAVYQSGKGEIVVARRPSLKSGARVIRPGAFLPCDVCNKFMSKSSLWRHKKTCVPATNINTGEGGEGEPLESFEDQPRSSRNSTVKESRALLNSTVFVGEEKCLTDLMDRMREDAVKEIVMTDRLIRSYAVVRMEALGHKSDQKPGDIYRVSQSVRTLGRVVQLARELIGNDVTLDSLLAADNFDTVVQVARKMSIEKAVPALNVGRTVGLLVKRVALIKRGIALREGNRQSVREARDFRILCSSDWNYRVNSAAMKRVNTVRRSKVQTIPITEDLVCLRTYILESSKKLLLKLRKSPPCPEDWTQMAKLTMSRLILFNKRRRAEVKDLKVKEYLQRPDWKEDSNGEMAMALSPTDRLLAKRCVTVVLLLYLVIYVVSYSSHA